VIACFLAHRCHRGGTTLAGCEGRTKDVVTCLPDDTINRAAQLMWERD
jgi:hypothetical protein